MNTLRVCNRQKIRAVNTPRLRQIAAHLVRHELGWTDYELALHLVGPDEMARLNQQFLGHEGSTDVITFDYREQPGAWRGEIFISIADALAQGREFGCAWQEEVARYAVHGLLHLAGYDDTQPALRRVMKRQENKLLKALSSRFELRTLARRKNV
ncbi:MAG TPA: rRNA maturation RNase YbeY [Verrucomicrobiae bacterium]|jgi:probable rRNA maturation factor|nr:rRNA maturation RNase YbeY [Verrucomicrobiae bacterium]